MDNEETKLDMNSILVSTKKKLGPSQDYTHFDPELIDYINGFFLDLKQLGVGPKEGFFISDETSTWDDFMSSGVIVNAVKTWMYLKVKLVFDPPTSSGAIDSINRQIDKLEWRMNHEAEYGQEDSEVNQNG